MFAGDETMATMNGCPFVERPSVSTCTAGDSAASRWKYDVICPQSASVRSAPTVKPRNWLGVGMALPDAGACAAAADASVRTHARAAWRMRSVDGGRMALGEVGSK